MNSSASFFRPALSMALAVTPIAAEFKLTKIEMGYLLSSFLWMYVLCLLPVGLLVDRFGGKIVNAAESLEGKVLGPIWYERAYLEFDDDVVLTQAANLTGGRKAYDIGIVGLRNGLRG